MESNDKNKKNNKNRIIDIVMYVVVGITALVALYIGHKIGVRSRSILYLLVALEMIVYCVIKWILGKIRRAFQVLCKR